MARTKQKVSLKKKVAAITAVTLAAILAIGSAYAWHDFSQSAINRNRGIVSPDVLLHDDFADEWIDGKREKDVYVENTGDIDTIVRIRFSEFLQIGNDKVVGTNSKDVKTWSVHTFNPGLPGHATSEAHKYFSWNMDGDQKVYLTDTSEMGYFEYEKTDYTWTEHHSITSTVDYTVEKGANGQPYGETLPAATVISMADYIADKANIDADDGCWIVDTDGWCYWSKQLKPGEATNMLLSSVEMIKNPNDNYAYNIYVDLEACNATEINDMIGKGMTKNAENNLINGLAGLVAIDSTNFPDGAFRDALLNGYTNNAGIKTFAPADTNGDGKLSEAERNAVTRIDMNGVNASPKSGITNVEGIKYFPNLTNLSLNDGNLVDLDITENKALISLSCARNNITNLNLGNLPALKEIHAQGNDLSTVNLSQCPELGMINLNSNSLISIDVSENLKLTSVDLGNNNLSGSIMFSENILLKSIAVNNNNITGLNVVANVNLEVLNFRFNSVPALNVGSNTKLHTLFANDNNVSTLDISATMIIDPTVLRLNNNGMTSLTINAAQQTAGIGTHATYQLAGNTYGTATVAP